jgi:ribosomal protein L37AE/L43A
MPDEKDRLGDKLREVEKGREDSYFAERDRALLQKLKTEASGKQEATLKELARMRCPKCGEHLTTTKHLDVSIDECPACRGVWLDKGELEEITRRESAGWLAAYLGRSG